MNEVHIPVSSSFNSIMYLRYCQIIVKVQQIWLVSFKKPVILTYQYIHLKNK